MKTPQGGAEPASTIQAFDRTFKFEPNPRKLESLRVERGGANEGSLTLVLRSDGREARIPCGRGEWAKARAALSGFPEQPVAASAAWTADDELTAKVVLVETPFNVTYRIKFEGDKAAVDPEVNVAFGATRGEPLTGKAE